MRFAWEEKQSAASSGSRGGTGVMTRMTVFVYNLAWWIPVVLAFTPAMSYRTGFLSFLAIVAVRFAANLYRNNALSVER